MAKKTARKTAKTSSKPKLSKKEGALVAKLNRALKTSGRHLEKLELKPKQTLQKLNDALTGAGFNSMEVKRLKLGQKKKKCLEYKAQFDSKGNFIGLVCVRWSS